MYFRISLRLGLTDTDFTTCIAVATLLITHIRKSQNQPPETFVRNDLISMLSAPHPGTQNQRTFKQLVLPSKIQTSKQTGRYQFLRKKMGGILFEISEGVICGGLDLSKHTQFASLITRALREEGDVIKATYSPQIHTPYAALIERFKEGHTETTLY